MNSLAPCLRIYHKQECIPVGCVPSTAVAVSPAMHTPSHAPTLPHMPPPPATHATPCPHHAHPCHAHPPPPPVERMTDACENITFPQLLLRTLIIKAQGWIQDFLYENISHLGAAPTLYFAQIPMKLRTTWSGVEGSS